MREIYDEIDNFEIEITATVQYFFRRYPERVEECHGLHYFNEDDLIDKKLLNFFVTLPDGTCIDLIDRLTKEEVEKIIQANNKPSWH